MMERLKVPRHNISSVNTPLLLRDRIIPVGKRTYLMGILNVTPDSFSDGGRYFKREDAIQRVEEMIEEGADFIDVGGESTRPGAAVVSAEEEIDRLLPVLEAWQKKTRRAILSIDTSKSAVADMALRQGASLVNDVTALRGDPELAEVVAHYRAGVVLMHRKGTPRTMQENPTYEDLLLEIHQFLEARIKEALRAGIREESIILDPGIGFGKTPTHNLEILRGLGALKKMGKTLLVGPSRKSFIGAVLEVPVEKRLLGTAAAVAISIQNGADIIRVHDVAEMKQVARMVDAIQRTDEKK